MMISNDQEQISLITIKYLGDSKLSSFAREMGIPSDRQRVWAWKAGRQKPSIDTLLAVLESPTATQRARSWARECLKIRRPGLHFSFEDDSMG